MTKIHRCIFVWGILLSIAIGVWIFFQFPRHKVFVTPASVVTQYQAALSEQMRRVETGATSQAVRDALLIMRVPEEMRAAHMQAIIQLQTDPQTPTIELLDDLHEEAGTILL